MRNIPPQFAAHLSGTATTICRCWKIIRNDGVVLGFSDHDVELLVDTVLYQPLSGLDASVAESSIGLNADSVEVLGALTSQKLSSKDIRANKYDGASVEVLVVNWSNPDEYLLENVYVIGEITEEDGLFKADLRTLESEFDQTRGEHFIRQCQASLGDGRCGVNLQQTAYQGQGSVISYDGNRQLVVSGLGSFQSNWFDGGKITWTSGANVGTRIEITQHVKDATSTRLDIWKRLPDEISPGDSFEITAGCDKNFHTCKSKFANALNFRGFPHLPDADFALSYASNSNNLDGGVLVE